MTRRPSHPESLVVPGFLASGVHCGIKDRDPDLALLVSEVPAAAAGVFTKSTVVGAPVEWCRERARRGRARAIVVNSGISNVGMGDRGRRDAAAMAAAAARRLGCDPEDVFVASTGVIGEPLPMARVRSGIASAQAGLAADGLRDAAEAIRTTDTRAKWAETTLSLGGRSVRIAGIAKGSGMIEPHMATMLSFLLTDAAVSPAFLRRVLRRVADSTYNRLTIDGETSTSDSVIVLANGLAGHRPIARDGQAGARRFEDGLAEVAEDLTRQLARDGEGATRLVSVEVTGARSPNEADRAARRIANSLLVKTAVFGRDPNWGRILQTVGAAGVEIRLERAEVRLAGVTVFRRGSSAGPAARRRAAQRHDDDEIRIEVALGAGRASARMWTCDLSTDYVRINAEYTT
ncbi:MAG: bifunctional glutamate N-acetyltransferase/amino-acid acetyltransferase ArgJ [Myxococcota bacterium]